MEVTPTIPRPWTLGGDDEDGAAWLTLKGEEALAHLVVASRTSVQGLVIAPEKPVEVATNESNGAKLLDLYLQGRQQVERRLAEIQDFVRTVIN